MAKKNLTQLPSFLITAGPTREYLDPVRFLSNPSTGKMGSALAQAAKPHADKVTLCMGPQGEIDGKGIRIIPFQTAKGLLKLVMTEMSLHDILIMTAAVSDYRPQRYQSRKIKKDLLKESMTIRFKKNPDILKTVSAAFGKKKFLVGFAAETHDISRNALKKLKEKNIPMIIANRVYKEQKGFSGNNSEVRVFVKGKGRAVAVLQGTKKNIAKRLLPIIIKEYTKFLKSA